MDAPLTLIAILSTPQPIISSVASTATTSKLDLEFQEVKKFFSHQDVYKIYFIFLRITHPYSGSYAPQTHYSEAFLMNQTSLISCF